MAMMCQAVIYACILTTFLFRVSSIRPVSIIEANAGA